MADVLQSSFDSAGQVRDVPALRTLEVSALGRPPMVPAPLQIDEGDSWDRRFLAEAILEFLVERMRLRQERDADDGPLLRPGVSGGGSAPAAAGDEQDRQDDRGASIHGAILGEKTPFGFQILDSLAAA